MVKRISFIDLDSKVKSLKMSPCALKELLVSYSLKAKIAQVLI